jgi:cytochrome c2
VEKFDSLFACFQYVDDADSSTHTAIGQLKLNKNIKSDSQRWDFLFDSNHKKVKPNNCAMDVSGSKIYFIIGTVNEGEINHPIAQDKENTLGKSYALDIVNRKVELLTLGHRVSLGIVARQDGQVWFTENGERGGDKLSYLIQNKNYGWPLKVSGTRYLQFTSSTNPRETHNSKVDLNSYVDPVYAWLPSIAPSALIELQDFNPAWDGDLLMGSLKAQSLYRIRLKDSHVLSIEQIYIGQRIRGIKQIKKEILLTTDEGTLVTVSIDSERLKLNSPLPAIPGGPQLLYCVNCHSISSADVTAGFGPSLRGIYGREIAAQNFPYFSDSLKKIIGIWDEAKLTSFLLDPSSFAPGTTMNLGINLSSEDVKKIVEVLKTLK